MLTCVRVCLCVCVLCVSMFLFLLVDLLVGTYYHEEGKYKAAVHCYNAAIEINSKCHEAYYNRAKAYGQLKMFKDALQDFTSVIDLKPNDLECHVKQGKYLILVGGDSNLGRAVRTLTRALVLKPQCGEAYLHRGTAYEKYVAYLLL
jgi:tetratricopeptide (TPR) repeat protein